MPVSFGHSDRPDPKELHCTFDHITTGSIQLRKKRLPVCSAST
jgi:hypothetical protein